MKKAALHNLGCKVNAYETEAMQQMLERAGYEIVPFSAKADIYIVNTCSVTNIADRKSRQMLHRAKKMNPDSIVVGTGCYVQTAFEEAQKDPLVDILIGNNCKKDLLELIWKFEQEHQNEHRFIDVNQGVIEYEELYLTKAAEHTRAFIKVQDGCNQFCSYCIIPYARGRVRSRKTEDIYKEALSLAQNGYQELVLTGIHLSSFGLDHKESLLTLIQTLHGIEGIRRIRLGSLEPGIITDEFVSELSKLKKVCPHFHLSLQSGSGTVLKRMNRKYTPEEYKDKCRILRTYYEHPALTTDIIVGFPGETKEEFQETLAFAEDIRFYEIHVFKYSVRKGTRAAVMPGQVSDHLKNERSSRLIALAEKLKQEFVRWYQGKSVSVLFEEEEEINGQRYMKGFTPEYVKVSLQTREHLENQIMEVEFSGDLY
ncbi:(Dimethylallyl)adenosine tRNA methylthiotransferase MiaB [uncultured Roseburia sp.]|uniref:tRNA (N(6)-L-threonylcarbamoyladenosine(37)-C(2))-methylthiotransferase MtaB n=1 Tax=Brotonthovivens ammoniilytica TaxID=2981725 RepID=A0ABT2TMG3_9FIRM|nr:tRNA (N(6)-L-threonylcarbamoyladenosine(37)-C(2))-methylthiotransferase MtaB [Brotonthovivens ammoniilytica]MCU6763393.1 tRNA (N(6)-L-threonylcarbamoyladenosine(37)-C(2))-methylthiotransferase MtaB [Brotonthovivens ammoniilytica]SCJ17696.1 (Dimethylallyl)adenosine tRNA methylthiotransferase MiaB [uncultured Roseburia sp.]